VQTILAGRADNASQGSDEVILGAAEGAEMVAVGAPSTAMDYVLVGSKGLDSVSDLEGKAIGMSGPAGFDALLARFALDDAGLETSAVNFVQIGGSPDRASALLTGQVDAATIFLEDWEELRQQTEDLHLIEYMAEIVPDFPATAFFGEANYWEENSDVALALACANLQANTFLNSSEDAYVDYVLQIVPGATEEAARAVYASGQEVNMWPEDADETLTVDGMSGLIDAMHETGEISQPVEPSSVVDVSYLQEAEEMGCGES
jgi:NitT/TauT family transport system substrate-binding protein